MRIINVNYYYYYIYIKKGISHNDGHIHIRISPQTLLLQFYAKRLIN